MSVSERLARLSNKVYDRTRSKAAFTIRAEDAVERDFEPLRGHKYATLVTFRKSGEAMPSPVWFGLDAAGRAYAHTMLDSGKVKRIRNNGKALIVASTTRGKPIGPVLAGTARVVPEDEWPHAEATLAAAYGRGRKVYMPRDGQHRGLRDLHRDQPSGTRGGVTSVCRVLMRAPFAGWLRTGSSEPSMGQFLKALAAGGSITETPLGREQRLREGSHAS